MYASKELAEDVLIETWTRFDFNANNGPVSVYQCEHCGQFHLTSRGPMNEKLSKAIDEGTIHRLREANRWTDKFRRR